MMFAIKNIFTFLNVSHTIQTVISIAIAFVFAITNAYCSVFTEADTNKSDAVQGDTIFVDNYDFAFEIGDNPDNVYVCDPDNKATGDIEIPETIVFDSKTYTVTEVNHYGFAGNKNITSVTLPSSITYIAPYAFSNCVALNYIGTNDYQYSRISIIGDNVTKIGDYAFYKCNLRDIYTGDNVTRIGVSAFEDNNLINIGISEKSDIEDRAFYNNPCAYIEYPPYLSYLGNNIINDMEEATIPVVKTNGYMGAVDASTVYYLDNALPDTESDFYKNSTFHNLYLKPSVLINEKKSGLWNSWSTEYHITDSVPLTIPSDRHYITMSRDFDVDLRHVNDNLETGVEPLKAYIVSDIDTSKNVLILEEITYIPSRLYVNFQNSYFDSGVLLKGTPGHTYYYTIGEEDYTKGEDEQMTFEKALSLTGGTLPKEEFLIRNNQIYLLTDGDLNSSGYNYYGLKEDKFHKYSKSGYVPYNKAYLRIPKSYIKNNSKPMSMIFKNADGTTSIQSIDIKKTSYEKDVMYNLQGMRVDDSYRGIVIVNGKKILKK